MTAAEKAWNTRRKRDAVKPSRNLQWVLLSMKHGKTIRSGGLISLYGHGYDHPHMVFGRSQFKALLKGGWIKKSRTFAAGKVGRFVDGELVYEDRFETEYVITRRGIAAISD